MKHLMALCLLFFTAPSYAGFQDGDIIFQISKSVQSEAIQLATHSRYSHMGIVYIISNKPSVYEAVQPVKMTRLNEWINKGQDKRFVLKRLKNSDAVLSPSILKKMKKTGQKLEGKKYDLYFEWSDDRIYCSELVWKIYMKGAGIKIGRLKKLRDFDLTDPKVRSLLQKRFKNKINLNEPVISPADMLASEELITISSN